MLMPVTSKPLVTHWATLFTKSDPSRWTEVESSELHEVSFTRTFPRHENVFPIIPNDDVIG